MYEKNKENANIRPCMSGCETRALAPLYWIESPLGKKLRKLYITCEAEVHDKVKHPHEVPGVPWGYASDKSVNKELTWIYSEKRDQLDEMDVRVLLRVLRFL